MACERYEWVSRGETQNVQRILTIFDFDFETKKKIEKQAETNHLTKLKETQTKIEKSTKKTHTVSWKNHFVN